MEYGLQYAIRSIKQSNSEDCLILKARMIKKHKHTLKNNYRRFSNGE